MLILPGAQKGWLYHLLQILARNASVRSSSHVMWGLYSDRQERGKESK